MNLEAVILYSGNDSRFAEACIKSLLKLDIKTHVVTYSHMWNGVPENKEKLQEPLNQFIDNYSFYQYVIDWEEGQSPWYWEGLGRYLGTQEVSKNSEYILYIDIDEIIDSEKFKIWIDTNEYKKYSCL